MENEVIVQEPKEQPILEVKQPRPTPIQVKTNDQGWLVGASIDERYRVAEAWFKSKMVPDSYENPIQVLGAMELSIQLGIPPLVGLSKIAVINGQPSIWGEMPLALVRKSGQLRFIREMLFDKDGKPVDEFNPIGVPYMATCKSERVDGSTSTTFFTMEDAKNAGLTGRNNPWKTYPRRMLQMRARSQCLKDLYPDVLMGVPMAEYDHNIIPDGKIRSVTQYGEEKRDAAKELGQMLTTGEGVNRTPENT